MACEDICAEIIESCCGGVPSDAAFKKYVIQLLCCLAQSGGGSGGTTVLSEVREACVDIEGTIIEVYAVITRNPNTLAITNVRIEDLQGNVVPDVTLEDLIKCGCAPEEVID